MRTKLHFTLAVLFILCSWTCKQKSQIKQAEWLLGTWVNDTPKGDIYETWSKENDLKLSGRSYLIKEKDTIVFETISLTQKGDGLVYTPTLQDQNEGLPISFVLEKMSDTVMVFVNLQHDFPQFISYTKTGKDSLVVEISGIINGLERKQIFKMIKVKF